MITIFIIFILLNLVCVYNNHKLTLYSIFLLALSAFLLENILFTVYIYTGYIMLKKILFL